MNTVYDDGIYFENNPTWYEEASSWKAMQIFKMPIKHNITPSQGCEVGCGAGEILNCLANELPGGTKFYGYLNFSASV